jgi:predicted amidohydrolase
MRVAAVQLDIAWEDKAANHATIERMLAEAGVAAGAFVLLPELGDTGYSFDLDAIVDDRTLAWAAGLARRLGIWMQPGFAQRGADGRGRNCAAIIDPAGEVLGVYRKIHPFSYSREPEFYGGGDTVLIRECAGVAVCPLICYDLRFPELWRFATLAGTEVFTIGASWPESRRAHWRSLLIARAIENQAYVVGVNRVGRDPKLGYAGGSMIIAPGGEVVAEAGAAPTVLSADLDSGSLRRWRQEFPALRDVQADLIGSMNLDARGERFG